MTVWTIASGQRRHEGIGAGRDDQNVVLEIPAVGGAHATIVAIDGERTLAQIQRNAVLLEETRAHQRELLGGLA